MYCIIKSNNIKNKLDLFYVKCLCHDLKHVEVVHVESDVEMPKKKHIIDSDDEEKSDAEEKGAGS